MVDYCKEVACDVIKAFIDKWDLLNEQKNHYSKDQHLQMQQEQPLNTHVIVAAIINGLLIRQNHGCGLSWIPRALVPEQPHNNVVCKLMDHYNLDPDKAWSINRCSIPWENEKLADVLSLELCLEPMEAKIPGVKFVAEHEGECVKFEHPLTGIGHVLTVQEIETKELSQSHYRFQDETMEYPTHFRSMTYTIEPDIDRNHITVLDCADGDSARPKKGISGKIGSDGASSIGIIGRADGPTAIIMGNPVPRTLHAACSAVRFEPVDFVEWRIIFREKLKEDIQVKII